MCAQCDGSMFLECSPSFYPVEEPPQNHTQGPNFCTLQPLLAYRESLFFVVMPLTGPRVLISTLQLSLAYQKLLIFSLTLVTENETGVGQPKQGWDVPKREGTRRTERGLISVQCPPRSLRPCECHGVVSHPHFWAKNLSPSYRSTQPTECTV